MEKIHHNGFTGFPLPNPPVELEQPTADQFDRSTPFQQLGSKVPILARSGSRFIEPQHSRMCHARVIHPTVITRSRSRNPLKGEKTKILGGWGGPGNQEKKARGGGPRPMGFSAGSAVEINQRVCHQTASTTRSQRRRLNQSPKAPLGHAHQIGGDAVVGMEKTEEGAAGNGGGNLRSSEWPAGRCVCNNCDLPSMGRWFVVVSVLRSIHHTTSRRRVEACTVRKGAEKQAPSFQGWNDDRENAPRTA